MMGIRSGGVVFFDRGEKPEECEGPQRLATYVVRSSGSPGASSFVQAIKSFIHVDYFRNRWSDGIGNKEVHHLRHEYTKEHKDFSSYNFMP